MASDGHYTSVLQYQFGGNAAVFMCFNQREKPGQQQEPFDFFSFAFAFIYDLNSQELFLIGCTYFLLVWLSRTADKVTLSIQSSPLCVNK